MIKLTVLIVALATFFLMLVLYVVPNQGGAHIIYRASAI
jgi:hypothetical protein